MILEGPALASPPAHDATAQVLLPPGRALLKAVLMSETKPGVEVQVL